MATFNRAAFSRDDVQDAKRGYPDFDLRDYATRRGLEFLDHGTPAGYRAAVPGAQELQSNVLRGVLPGGGYGVIANEGLEIGYSGDSFDWGGTFYNVRVIAKGDFGGILGFVPVVNWFVGSSATATVRLPCTVAAVRVPQTAGILTQLRVDRRRSSPPFSFGNRTRLGDLVGHKGWDLYAGEKPDPDVVVRLAAEPVAGLLRAHTADGLFQAVVWWGTLVVRRNGYLRSPEQLDELARAASLLAARLREVCPPLAEPRRFDTALPRPHPRTARARTRRPVSSSRTTGAGGARRRPIATDWSPRTRSPTTAPSHRCRCRASPVWCCAERSPGSGPGAGWSCTVISVNQHGPQS